MIEININKLEKNYGFNKDWFVFGGETPLSDQL